MTPTDAPTVLELPPGGQATFGRDDDADVVLADPGVSRVAGSIRACDDYWLISNLSTDTTYVVDNPEGGGEFIKVPPRRLNLPVPFELARIMIPAATGAGVSFLVFAPVHAYLDADAPFGPDGTPTEVAFPLDETAKYFLVLVALCEPRLRDGASPIIPSVPTILERLRPLEAGRDLTRAAVNFHVDYLARIKLRVREPVGHKAGSRADWQRAALVTVALRFNLVHEGHLALLP